VQTSSQAKEAFLLGGLYVGCASLRFIISLSSWSWAEEER
jgi:hypothetical protein